MKNYTLLFIILINTSLFAQSTKTTSLGDFYKIKIFSGIKLELIKDKENKLEITDNETDRVRCKNNNGVLKISLKFPDNLSAKETKVKLYYKQDILVIDVNEGSTITGNGIYQTNLEVKAQEGATIQLNINTKHLKVKSVTGSIINLTGKTKNQEIEVDLYGVYHGYGIETIGNTIVKSGIGSKAEIKTGETLNAKVSFGGSVLYKGTPEVKQTKKVAGGIIKQMN
ncbi:DUF2807 domain-containing protein [Flavobacteriaceae bacterium]|nr:DUF2807 domain-containing protein [Flavobacteriaceae bacterium]MDC0331226.1 DUF2807 domain-containing protein [Flavobacteriaceae bacterium]